MKNKTGTHRVVPVAYFIQEIHTFAWTPLFQTIEHGTTVRYKIGFIFNCIFSIPRIYCNGGYSSTPSNGESVVVTAYIGRSSMTDIT